MRKLILIAHTSLDGFVAFPNGDLSGFDASDENLEFVWRLTDHADAAMFGRKSYQLLESYWPTAAGRANATKAEIGFSNWYNAAEKIVLSKTMNETNLQNTKINSENVTDDVSYANWYDAEKNASPKTMEKTNLHNIKIISDNVADEISKIKQQPGKDILIFGSPATFQTVFEAGLVDSYWIFINPVIFGKGIPLFKESKNKVNLKLMATKQFANGELALHYISG